MPSETFGVATKIVAGGVAGVSETIITYPAEFVKTWRQLYTQSGGQHGAPRSFTILRSTLAQSGFSGVYSGCQALATSNAFKAGIRFLTFETSRDQIDRLIGLRAGERRSPWVNVLSGLSAGAVESVFVVTPGEALKTRMIHAASTAKETNQAQSISDAVKSLLRERGIGGLWSGLGPVLCSGTLAEA
ncbi:hypothetical protein TruAng_011058 [Truncatella angustata]|nr:hypothetical protein TruAng_011058 [Truncatella angustata]